MRKFSLFSACFLILTALSIGAVSPPKISPDKKQSFSIEQGEFKIDGKPIILLSGEIHYPRTPRAYWRDRLKKARAMGLNTICTYTFWNLHEPQPGKWDFKDNNDLVAFVKMCQEEGLFVIIRPGPYICTEWDCGGIPGWTLADPKAVIRDNNPQFMKPAMKYLAKISRLMEPLSVDNGGPILMLQVENEYGSFGSDKDYLKAHVEAIRKGGWKGELFTSDGPNDRMIKGGTLPGITASMNFGDNSKSAFQKHAEYRQGEARMVGEFWVGWFDHWLKSHHSTAAGPKAKEFNWLLSQGISVNIYMFHGGTNFGYYAGANENGKKNYNSDTTSYDYSAVLSESGQPTDKFFAFKEVIKKRVPTATFGPMPKPTPTIDLPDIKIKQSANLFDHLPKPIKSKQPLTMEQLGQSFGFILYEKELTGPINDTLSLTTLQDRAQVYIDGKQIGILDRRSKQLTIPINLSKGKHALRILVENMGRVNFGHGMRDERKGIRGDVKLAGKTIKGWKNYSLPLNTPSGITFTETSSTLPQLKKAIFTLKKTGDTWLNMETWGKGVVFVNGHNLGRYWSRGPQQTLYLPGCWLNKGENEIIVLELEKQDSPDFLGSAEAPIWEVRVDSSLLTRKKGQKLNLQGEKPIVSSNFTTSSTWQKITFEQPVKGRYFTIESLSSIDGNPHSAIAELEILDGKGNMIPRETLAVIYADSEELLAESGNAQHVIDSQPTTWWHTEWKDKSPAHPHSLVIDLGKIQKISGFRYLPRPGSLHGRIKKYRIFIKESPFKGL